MCLLLYVLYSGTWQLLAAACLLLCSVKRALVLLVPYSLVNNVMQSSSRVGTKYCCIFQVKKVMNTNERNNQKIKSGRYSTISGTNIQYLLPKAQEYNTLL